MLNRYVRRAFRAFRPRSVACRRSTSDVLIVRLHTDARWLVESGGAVVAVGGLLFHYNVPYGDMFMEVAEPYRRRGGVLVVLNGRETDPLLE